MVAAYLISSLCFPHNIVLRVGMGIFDLANETILRTLNEARKKLDPRGISNEDLDDWTSSGSGDSGSSEVYQALLDVPDSVFLVCRIIRIGGLELAS
ncbi:hypothetical protein WG66_007808 [Moniliophthora roreri]|nr:hypothetical protein WG66_007808 [Moniliophthora roreri]